jgi:hypothetical protein
LRLATEIELPDEDFDMMDEREREHLYFLRQSKWSFAEKYQRVISQLSKVYSPLNGQEIFKNCDDITDCIKIGSAIKVDEMIANIIQNALLLNLFRVQTNQCW